MLLTILAYVCTCALALILCEVVSTTIRNRNSQQQFKKRCPNLPIAPKSGIFGGHIRDVIWAKRSWKKIGDLHKKYGKTFGMFYGGKPYVCTTDLNFIRAVVLDRPNDHVNRLLLRTPMDEFDKDSILSCEDQQWRRLRNLVAPAFTKCKIMQPNVQSEIHAAIGRFINSLEMRLDQAKLERSEKSIKLDVDEMFFRYTNALVFSCFYKQTNLVDFHGESDPFSHMIDHCARTSVNWIAIFGATFPRFLPIIRWLMMRFHPLGTMHNRIESFIKRQTLLNLKARMQHAENGAIQSADTNDIVLEDGTKFRRNLIDYVIDRFHEGKMTKSEYLNNSGFLFLAASKTSADAISKLLYHLALKQDEQEKLRASVKAEGVDSEYLHWSIHESLRLFPPVPVGCSRELSYDMTTTDGITIPAGTTIHTPAPVINRLPEYWGLDSNEFKPERWRQSSSFHPMQYLAFGAGKRKCFGGDFAQIEIKLLMRELLARYKFELAPDTNADTINQHDTYIFFTTADYPLNLIISRLSA